MGRDTIKNENNVYFKFYVIEEEECGQRIGTFRLLYLKTMSREDFIEKKFP